MVVSCGNPINVHNQIFRHKREKNLTWVPTMGTPLKKEKKKREKGKRANQLEDSTNF